LSYDLPFEALLLAYALAAGRLEPTSGAFLAFEADLVFLSAATGFFYVAFLEVLDLTEADLAGATLAAAGAFLAGSAFFLSLETLFLAAGLTVLLADTLFLVLALSFDFLDWAATETALLAGTFD